MKKWLLGILLLGVQAFGGYGPNQDMAIQVQDILTSNEITSTFPLGVNLVEKVDSGYLLKGEGKEMLVDVIPLPSDSMGRPKYKLRFHTLKTKRESQSG